MRISDKVRAKPSPRRTKRRRLDSWSAYLFNNASEKVSTPFVSAPCNLYLGAAVVPNMPAARNCTLVWIRPARSSVAYHENNSASKRLTLTLNMVSGGPATRHTLSTYIIWANKKARNSWNAPRLNVCSQSTCRQRPTETPSCCVEERVSVARPRFGA
mgnify:CR=1 FL=1